MGLVHCARAVAIGREGGGPGRVGCVPEAQVPVLISDAHRLVAPVHWLCVTQRVFLWGWELLFSTHLLCGGSVSLCWESPAAHGTPSRQGPSVQHAGSAGL